MNLSNREEKRKKKENHNSDETEDTDDTEDSEVSEQSEEIKVSAAKKIKDGEVKIILNFDQIFIGTIFMFNNININVLNPWEKYIFLAVIILSAFALIVLFITDDEHIEYIKQMS